MQRLHYRQACIQSDEVGELQRTHRMVGAKSHRRIDRIDCPDSLVKGVDGFIDQWQQDSIDDECGEVRRLDNSFAELVNGGSTPTRDAPACGCASEGGQ
jgi:hypothetical protein